MPPTGPPPTGLQGEPGERRADVDEERHEAGADPWWAETFGFDLWSTDALTGAFTWLTLLPVQRRAWYWCGLVRPGERLLHVADLDLPLPIAGLRVRTTGLWADHLCEAPYEQWTVQNECYAVALDDPTDALDRAYGEATPIACDIEWYAGGPPAGGRDAYTQPGEAHSVIELAGAVLELVGPAARWHTWGPLRLPTGPIDGDGLPAVFLRGPGSLVVERRLAPEGWRTTSRGTVPTT